MFCNFFLKEKKKKKQLDFTTKADSTVVAQDAQVAALSPNGKKISVEVNGAIIANCLLDDASSITYMRKSVAEAAGIPVPRTSRRVKCANGSYFFVNGPVNINLMCNQHAIKATAYISNNDECPSEMLIGNSFLHNFKTITYDKEKKMAHFGLTARKEITMKFF